MKRVVKRGIALFLMLVVLATSGLTTELVVHAEETSQSDKWEGFIPISTKGGLDKVRDNPTANYYLTNDIVFAAEDFSENGSYYNGGYGWKPIAEFSGIFDGNGYSISGLWSKKWMASGKDAGIGLFFRVTNGTIRNLELKDGNIEFDNNNSYAYTWESAGGFAAYTTNSLYYNCHNSNKIIGNSTGGIAGYAQGCRFENCSNTGTVIEDAGFAGNESAGGIVGWGSENEFYSCVNRGSITTIAGENAGGIAGYIRDSSLFIKCENYGKIYGEYYGSIGGIGGDICTSEIYDCYNYGNLTDGIKAGGITAYASSCKIERCANKGSIDANLGSGGIVATAYGTTSIAYCFNNGSVYVYGDRSACAGGIISGQLSSDDSITIKDCYNTGKIKSRVGSDLYYYSAQAGGISGSGGHAIRCYNIGEVIAERGKVNGSTAGVVYEGGLSRCYAKSGEYSYEDGATQVSENEMKKAATYKTFDFSKVWAIDENMNEGFPYLRDTLEWENTVSDLLGNIDMGPFDIQGAEIDVLGRKIPLINIEAGVELEFQNFKIIAKQNITDDTISIKVILGFDQEKVDADIKGTSAEDVYWSDAYKDVKDLYQTVTSKKVDTTRLWNDFSSLRSKLKKMEVSMLVEMEACLAGYFELEIADGDWALKEGGVLISFDAKTDIRKTFFPAYISLGLELNAEGLILLAEKNNLISPELTVELEPIVSVNGGVGSRDNYLEIGLYGSLPVKIDTREQSLRVGLKAGIRMRGGFLGQTTTFGDISIATELYPDPGAEWNARSLLTGNMDVSDVNVYRDLINSATPLERNYLITTYALRGATLNSYEGVNFEKHNLYTLSSPNLVRFDDDTMLLVWVDDTGEKTSENRCSLMYSFYNGTDWSEPAVIYEDGMMVDMPYVYSDGQYAYIVWQKASIEFDAETELTDTLSYYDLYATVFNSSTQTFAENVCITPEDETTFELSPIVYGNAGAYKVAWVENTDNNIYQMSGTNTLYVASYDESGALLEKTVIHSSAEMFTDYAIDSTATVFSVIESGTNVLYYTATNQYKVKAGIHAFEYVDGVIFYTDTTGLRSIAGDKVSGTSLLMTLYTKKHNNIGGLDEFSLIKSDTEYVIFYDRLNEDFSKSLYYSKLSVNDTTNTWTDFEVYSANGTYIRNYSPVVLSDGEVHVAFNYIVDDGETETASLVVDQCTDMVDLSTAYVVFEDAELVTGTLNLKIGIENHSSKAMTSFDVMVFDSEGNLVLTKTIDQELKAFEETELTLEYELPQTYANEIYSVQVMPCEYDELDETNNVARTTFECIHSPSEEWTIDIMPTTETTGIKSRHCLHCDEHLDECEIPVITTDENLVFVGASVTLFDDLTVNFKANASLFETYTSPYVVFEQNGAEVTVSEYVVDGGYYVFAFAGVLPNQMNDEISATLYATVDGTVYKSEAKAYSVATYCYNMLGKYGDDEKLRTLLVDILNYGAATQIYTNHNTANLANAALTDEQKAWASPERDYTSVENDRYEQIANSAVTWIGAGLNLSESIAVRYEFTAESVEGLTAKVTCGGKTWEIADFSKNEKGEDVLLVRLNAGYMSEPIYVTLYDGETAVSNTVCYSIESYAFTYGDDAALGDLVRAMMKYGDAASAYITKG